MATRVFSDTLTAPGDPHQVPRSVQLHSLVHELERRSVEAHRVAQIPVARNPDGPVEREVKRRRGQRPERHALLGQPLGHDEPAGGMPTTMRHLITPARIDHVELGQRGEPPGRPEPALHIADGPSTDPFSRGVDGVHAVE